MSGFRTWLSRLAALAVLIAVGLVARVAVAESPKKPTPVVDRNRTGWDLETNKKLRLAPTPVPPEQPKKGVRNAP